MVYGYYEAWKVKVFYVLLFYCRYTIISLLLITPKTMSGWEVKLIVFYLKK